MNAIIVGGGKVGMRLAALLQAAQHQVTVIELRAEHVAEVERLVTGVRGRRQRSGSRPAGACRHPPGAGAGGSNGQRRDQPSGDEPGALEFGIPRTIARVNNPANAWLYNGEMGVDVALNQADLMAHLILEEMSLGDMMTLLKLRRGAYSLVEEKVHPQAVAAGKRVAELQLPRSGRRPCCVAAACCQRATPCSNPPTKCWL